MKRLAVLFTSLAPLVVLAQEKTFAGTKKDIVSAPVNRVNASSGILPLLQMLAALAIVFVLIKYLLPKIATKFGKKLNTKIGAGIQVEESASFGGGMLYIVEARGKALLVAVGSQGVTCLADLTQKEDAQDKEPFQTFREMLVEQPQKATATFNALVQVAEEDEPVQKEDPNKASQAQEALETLRRFVS